MDASHSSSRRNYLRAASMKVRDGVLWTNSGTIVTHLSQLYKYFYKEETWAQGFLELDCRKFGTGKQGEAEMADFLRLIREGKLQVIDGPVGSPMLGCVNNLGPGRSKLKRDSAEVESDVPMPLRTRDYHLGMSGVTNGGKKFFAYHKFGPAPGDGCEGDVVLVGYAGQTVAGGGSMRDFIFRVRNGGCLRVAVLRGLLRTRKTGGNPISVLYPKEHVVQLEKGPFGGQLVKRSEVPWDEAAETADMPAIELARLGEISLPKTDLEHLLVEDLARSMADGHENLRSTASASEVFIAYFWLVIVSLISLALGLRGVADMSGFDDYAQAGGAVLAIVATFVTYREIRHGRDNSYVYYLQFYRHFGTVSGLAMRHQISKSRLAELVELVEGSGRFFGSGACYIHRGPGEGRIIDPDRKTVGLEDVGSIFQLAYIPESARKVREEKAWLWVSRSEHGYLRRVGGSLHVQKYDTDLTKEYDGYVNKKAFFNTAGVVRGDIIRDQKDNRFRDWKRDEFKGRKLKFL